MGWWHAIVDRFMKSNGASSTSNTPLFAVDCTEPLLLTVDVPPELTVRELNKATKSFSDSRLIAREHNITVYKAVLPSGGRPAAAKRIRKPLPLHETWTADDDAFLRRQVSVLSMLKHDNFVRLLGYTITDDIRVLLFELATVVMLRAVVHGPTEDSPQPGRPALTLSWAQRTRIALDAARGLQYLHEAAAVSHWGVSSSKVLLFDGLRAKIADYDVFQQQQRDDELAGGRRVNQSINPYEPPEYAMTGCRIPYKTDVYSFGIVLLELLTGRSPRDIRLDNRSYKLQDSATAMMTKERVKQCIDPKLGTQYPPTQALRLGTIALFCLHDNHRSRPSMGDVAQAISYVIGN